MKKLISIALALAMCVGFSSCGGDDGYIEESSSEIVTTRKAEPVVTEPKKISESEAYTLAEAYVPSAILDNYFLRDATGYKITDYDYEGTHYDNIFEREEHCFKFYGKYAQEDKYGDYVDSGYFYANIYVPVNEDEKYKVSGSAYKDMKKS